MVSWTSLAPRVFTRASGAILATNSAIAATSSGSAEHGAGQAEHRILVSRAAYRPRGPRLGLVHRLAEVGAQALRADQPGPGQGLPHQVLEVGIRGPLGGLGRRAVGEPDGQAVPLGDLVRPVLRPFGEHGQPGADVLLPLGVVGRQRGHGGRPPPGETPGGGVELGRADAEDVRVAAHLVQRGQPRPAVEGGVLDPLGQHRARGLAEPHDQLVPGGLPVRVAGHPAQAEYRRPHRVQHRVQASAPGPPGPRPRPR